MCFLKHLHGPEHIDFDFDKIDDMSKRIIMQPIRKKKDPFSRSKLSRL